MQHRAGPVGLRQLADIGIGEVGGAFPGSAKVTHEPVVQQIAQEVGATPARVGLAWLLHHADNTLLIPGTTSPAHLQQNVAAGSVDLDATPWLAWT